MDEEDYDNGESGVVAWIRRWWRALVAELISTAILVWFGVSSVMPVRGPGTVELTHPAFAFGFVITANLMAFGPTSGAHMNPSVTLAAVLYGNIPIIPAVAYIVVQTIGAILGFGVLIGTTAASLSSPHGCTEPAPAVSALSAMLLEAAMTAVLSSTCCALWAAHDESKPDHSVPIKLGLMVVGLVCAGGHATGASLNPARSFASALLHGYWNNLWVYVVGPMAGSAAGVLLHQFILMPRRKRTIRFDDENY